LPSCYDDHLFVEKDFYIQIIGEEFLVVGLHQQEHSDIDGSFAQSRGFRCQRAQLLDVQDYPRIGLRKPMNDGWKDGSRKCFLASDPHLSHGRIGQEFDVPHALPEFVERCVAAGEQRTAVFRRLDAPRAAIKKAHTERVLELGDHLGDGGLGHAQGLRGFCHAAPLHGREKDVQIPQPQPPPDTTFPVDFLGHNRPVMGVE